MTRGRVACEVAADLTEVEKPSYQVKVQNPRDVQAMEKAPRREKVDTTLKPWAPLYDIQDHG